MPERLTRPSLDAPVDRPRPPHIRRPDEFGLFGCGARSPEEDIARKTGTGTTRARRKPSTSKRLRTQPKTDGGRARGKVSTDQADEVSGGAGAAPQAPPEQGDLFTLAD